MSGHSHWANIQHKKGAADNKRGKVFSKLARYIMIAAKNGGGDPAMNLPLRYAIEKARSVSMPKDNIERAVKKGCGENGGVTFDEIAYEGFGPGGSAIFVDILTDNRSRTNGEVRKIFEKGGGNMGGPGCTAHMFDRKGLLQVPALAVDEDALMELALEAGADDVERLGDLFEIRCDPTAFQAVRDALAKANLSTTMAEMTRLPKDPMDVDAEMGRKIIRLLEALDDHDDVQSVYTNAKVTEEMMGS
ncbi:MAG: YebC/PmpR family DNA-binding transcriptional regulator [Planctomycetota bacterium]|nr:MAG: YebC/PmpR family DNA-binding transcriptional regulator [Planctomycetota bacterium]